MVDARAQSEASGQTEHVYTEARYAARTWEQERRVVIKAEVVRLNGRAPRDNARFVITTLRQTPRFVYERVYCARGDIENRIKELHDGLQIGRTSCCRFWANQLRVLLTAAAYVLLQELRLRAARTRVRARRSRGCAIGCSNWASTSSSPCAASSCICRPRRLISPLGATSRSRSARVQANRPGEPRAPSPSVSQPTARRRSCLRGASWAFFRNPPSSISAGNTPAACSPHASDGHFPNDHDVAWRNRPLHE
ncbi:MAG: transposase [Vicinamibacterales bacterium]